jgi:predicted MFS family arabinose efflux permease
VLLATREAGAGDAQETAVEKRAAPVGLIALVAFILLLQVAGEGVGRTFFNVYLDDSLHVPTARIGVIAALGQLASVPAALATPLLMSRWGNGRTFVLGSLGMALSLLLLSFVHHWVVAGLGFMGLFAALSITIPAFNIFSQESVSPGWRGVMSGTTMTALGISFSVMALGGGYTIAALGYKSVFLMGAGLTAAGALLFWACFLRRSRSPRR